MLVEAVAADAKQFTESRLGIVTTRTIFLRQALNYLAPDFFLIGRL